MRALAYPLTQQEASSIYHVTSLALCNTYSVLGAENGSRDLNCISGEALSVRYSHPGRAATAAKKTIVYYFIAQSIFLKTHYKEVFITFTNEIKHNSNKAELL